MIGVRLFGVLLITCGALVAALCAPCTIIGVDMLIESGDDRAHMTLLLTAVWAVPMVAGLITAGVGVFLLVMRRPREGDQE